MGMIKPTALLALFPEATDLKSVADEVERETMRMIDEAKYIPAGSRRRQRKECWSCIREAE
jgi:hypothetical protein